ncbi:metabolite traffic protein EboE [Catenuloplanes atrovinosus]|uniref:Sugar phosphate isomerase/epimerase n=1 Tax=Catenuloplanes atrovinosus TaxID=137266 RepID=A0AAE4C8S0_9ACTN|nr:metabolite traffic protein EboE [Catenuloplanes atrovinosus]MDR7275816.1 sugar phosphate isomerase/epimerase [Catenuloplanes atrovinosus]
MRLRHADGTTVHLGYCTNVHPAEDLPGIVAQFDSYAVPIRERLGVPVLGLGLWLAAPVAAGLAADRAAVHRLRSELAARGLEVVTLNGFPYQAFQAPVVKHAVYHPDWSRPDRLRYTMDLAEVLAQLLPDDARRGSVSTLPLAWRTPWDEDTRRRCRDNLDALAGGLAALERRSGRTVRVAFEPEPGCVVESTAQAVTHLREVDTERLGVCLDLAHLACAWEEPREAVARLDAAGVPIVKVQVSAALESADPRADEAVLRGYVEPRFLHQTRSRAGRATDDLDEALSTVDDGPWRVHYHVPLHADPIPPLRATTGVLADALTVLAGGDTARCDHLDVETYTWGVLPPERRPSTPDELAGGIAAELAYARDLLTTLGLAHTVEANR